jgi:arabinose-5-phosphate isomerase
MSERAQRVSHANGAGYGVPASERAGGSGGAKPPGKELDLARKVLAIEAAAIMGLVDRLNGDFERAVQLLFECKGRVIVTGMGKSGIICRKIAATLSSTGTSAFFLHPAEAIHGDLGAIREDDVVVALSHSGETEELIRLLESIRRIGARLIAITGSPKSTLAKAADVTLDCGIAEEACPMNLVPTASTTAALALGDALAMTLLVRKGFREEQFASLHPGGKLGRRLMTVENVMVAGDSTPRVEGNTQMPDIIHQMSSKRLGMTCVVDAGGRLEGVFTDGDLRRLMVKRPPNAVMAMTAAEAMTPKPLTIGRNMLAVEALRIMETHKITSVIVVNGDGLVEGVVHLHDLWRTNMF